MKKTVTILALTIALSACSQSPADDEILPGNWEMSVGITDIEVPGATKEQTDSFASAMDSMTSQEQCVTAAETKFDPSEMASAFAQGGDCKAGEFDVSGGKIAGSLACKTTDGTDANISIAGTIDPENFNMSAKTEVMQDVLPEGKAKLTIEVKGKRIGDC